MIEWLGESGILVAAAVLAYLLARYALLPLIHRAANRTATRWDNILADPKVLNRLAWFAPLVVIRLGIAIVLDDPELAAWLDFEQRLTEALMILTGLLVLSAASSATNRIYTELEISKQRPIKGYLQIGMIIAWVLGAIVIVARLADQEIGLLLGGIGALSAVTILVFQDTILSLVAAVQLTSNDMLRVGDWLEMPSQDADGDVVEIALHTVKVQNWDMTITTIPTHKLISDSFRNWRGMTESGGRRIKRPIMIDLSTVRFLTEDEVDRWTKFAPLAEYMAAKGKELAQWNAQHAQAGGVTGEQRRLTNVGTFRAYLIAYLKARPDISDTMTLLVRQLAPTTHGLPIELYAFTSTTEWNAYESIQADIFDHLLAVIGEFGLRIHQSPSGADISSLAQP